MGLIFFDGGPLDGRAYQTKDLLGLPALELPLDGYVWTSDRRKSEKTGAIAQVWRFQNDLVVREDPPVPMLVDSPTPQITLDGVGPVLPPGAEPWEEGDNRVTPDIDSPVPEEVDTPGIRPEPGDETGDEDPAGPYGQLMRQRRDAIGATRKTVCELTGINPSRLYAIELGKGREPSAQERGILDAVLTRLEEEHAAATTSGGAH